MLVQRPIIFFVHSFFVWLEDSRDSAAASSFRLHSTFKKKTLHSSFKERRIATRYRGKEIFVQLNKVSLGDLSFFKTFFSIQRNSKTQTHPLTWNCSCYHHRSRAKILHSPKFITLCEMFFAKIKLLFHS